MGHAYEEQLLPDRHALLFQMQAYAVAEPEIRAHVRDGFGELRADGRRSWPACRRRRPGTSSPTGCCSTSSPMLELDRRAAGARVIFRHRRAILVGSLGARCWSAAVFALPVFGELGNDNDFDDPSAEAVTARNAVTRATGALRGAEHRRARAAGRAGGVARGAGADRARSRRRCAIAGVASVVAYEPGGDRRLVSTRRPLDVPAGDLRRNDAGRAHAHRAAAARRAVT